MVNLALYRLVDLVNQPNKTEADLQEIEELRDQTFRRHNKRTIKARYTHNLACILIDADGNETEYSSHKAAIRALKTNSNRLSKALRTGEPLKGFIIRDKNKGESQRQAILCVEKDGTEHRYPSIGVTARELGIGKMTVTKFLDNPDTPFRGNCAGWHFKSDTGVLNTPEGK